MFFVPGYRPLSQCSCSAKVWCMTLTIDPLTNFGLLFPVVVLFCVWPSFIAILSVIKAYSLVWYIPKQWFTSMLVNSSGYYHRYLTSTSRWNHNAWSVRVFLPTKFLGKTWRRTRTNQTALELGLTHLPDPDTAGKNLMFFILGKEKKAFGPWLEFELSGIRFLLYLIQHIT